MRTIYTQTFVIALHRDVEQTVAAWQQNSKYRIFASRFEAFRRAVCAGGDEADMLYGRLFYKRLKGQTKLFEHGCKQKGGAPRLFEAPYFSSHIFVAAGVEKSNTGCKELSQAKKRETALLHEAKRLEQISSVEDWKSLLGPAYTSVVVISKRAERNT